MMRQWLIASALVLAASTPQSRAASQTVLAEVVERTAPVYLGTAAMADDGSITISLDRKLNGKRAEEMIRYPTSDPAYRQIIEHVGGLKPGESKPVLSWPPGT